MVVVGVGYVVGHGAGGNARDEAHEGTILVVGLAARVACAERVGIVGVAVPCEGLVA